MYNLMEQYLIMGMNIYDNQECAALLALYYANKNDKELSMSYYRMAVEYDSLNKKIYFDTFIKNAEIVKILTIIEEENQDKNNRIYKKLEELSNSRVFISIYKKKIRLFTQLNHITECGICFEVELNINLFCGHCVCKNCYLELDGSPCPFCRI